ncbi:hypothetical protein [Fibrella arboris]|uniref:hypothetical protein n=1 Tax=Fibrella arboris TaxID=3242486 RepID=UPI003521D78B
MKAARTLLVAALLTGTLTDCKKTAVVDSQASPCQPPTQLVAQAPCESGYAGALLIASAYKETDYTSFLFEVFPQKDTLSNDLSVRAWKNGANTHERILISDDVLKDAPKFLVQVSLTCGTGKEYKSQLFAFVKRPGQIPACYVWGRQHQ